jgi:hypothetical protein
LKKSPITTGYGPGRRPSQFSDFADQHYNYEDESQEALAAGEKRSGPGGSRRTGIGDKASSSKPFVASWMIAKAKPPSPLNSESSRPASSQEPAAKDERLEGHSIDNIARFFGGKSGTGTPGSLPRRVPQVSPLRPGNPRQPMDIPAPTGAANLKKGQRVRHAKYGEGTILMREGDGEDAKLTVLFSRHGMKKLMEKFANLQKL